MNNNHNSEMEKNSLVIVTSINQKFLQLGIDFCLNAPLAGTEKQTIYLYRCLKKNFSDSLEISLFNCLDHTFYYDKDSFFIPQSNSIIWCDLLITPQIYLNTAKKIKYKKKIIWIHHSFARYYGNPKSDLVVSCCKYSDLTLSTNCKKDYVYNKLPYFAPSPNNCISTSSDSRPKFKIAYIGAMSKPKSLHILLKDVKILESSFNKNVHIDVIGGESLYKQDFDDNFKHKTELISTYFKDCYEISSQYQRSSIDYHGTLGQEKYEILKSANIIVVNPTGISEAFSTTLLECFVNSLFVISGNSFGNRELLLNNVTAHYTRKNLLNLINNFEKGSTQDMIINSISMNRRLFSRLQQSDHSFLYWNSIIKKILNSRSFSQNPHFVGKFKFFVLSTVNYLLFKLELALVHITHYYKLK